MTDDRIVQILINNRGELYNAIMYGTDEQYRKAKLAENRGIRALERRGYTVTRHNFSVVASR